MFGWDLEPVPTLRPNMCVGTLRCGRMTFSLCTDAAGHYEGDVSTREGVTELFTGVETFGEALTRVYEKFLAYRDNERRQIELLARQEYWASMGPG